MANNKGWDTPKRYLRIQLYKDDQQAGKKNTLAWLTEDEFVRFDISAAVSCG